MPQISFKDWKLTANLEDGDILRVDIEALDGSDIIEMGYAVEGTSREGEPYVMRFTTEKIEATNRKDTRQARELEAGGPEEDEGGPVWSDDEETIYTRGWEVNALIDEEGMLSVEVERQDDAEIFVLEPIESGAPLASHLTMRLAAEEEIEDEDEDEDEEDELDDEGDEFDDLDDLDEIDDYEDREEEDEVDYDDLFEEEDERY